MKSLIVKRSIVVGGHKTSVSLEKAFWDPLKEIAKRYDLTLSILITQIDASRRHSNLSSAIRLFVLADARGERIVPGVIAAASSAVEVFAGEPR